MNVTELARKLKIPTQELREKLPRMGFDFGARAIKIPDNVAGKIIRDWERLNLRLEIEDKKAKLEEEVKEERAEKINITLPSTITVKDLADKLDVPVVKVLESLMKNGIFVSMNESLDFDTAAIISDEFNAEAKIDASSESDTQNDAINVSDVIKNEKDTDLFTRPPVIVIMGHVDHGKTKLLDTIRTENVVEGEAGGITQHIGAYQVTKNGKKITFIDTPGHEAFTAMRSRGAKVADIAILVVAADDSVKPQTIEALKIIEQSKVPMIVAINKIDKEEANIDKVKQDLSQHNLIPEDWGGKTIMVPVSAMTGKGVDDLLDNILLVHEVNQAETVANPQAPALGTVIESHVDKGEGPVATVLIQNGTLHRGDNLCVGESVCGKVRTMKDWNAQEVNDAAPSMPVKIIGFKIAPKVGDVVEVKSNIKGMRKKTKTYMSQVSSTSSKEGKGDEELKKLNVIIKADVLGSLEAITESLEKIHHPNVTVQIISKGLGSITDVNVTDAANSDAMLIGFNVSASQHAESLAKEKGVEIKEYSVIYHLIEEIKKRMENMLSDKIIKKEMGRAEVLAVFKTNAGGHILGCKITDGIAKPDAKVDIQREGIDIATGTLTELRVGKQIVNEVATGLECGIKYEGNAIIEVGDTMMIYTEETKEQKID